MVLLFLFTPEIEEDEEEEEDDGDDEDDDDEGCDDDKRLVAVAWLWLVKGTLLCNFLLL